MDDGGGARRLRGDAVTLAHGAGGRAMRDLIDEIFLKAFGETRVSGLEDQARLALDAFGVKGLATPSASKG